MNLSHFIKVCQDDLANLCKKVCGFCWFFFFTLGLIFKNQVFSPHWWFGMGQTVEFWCPSLCIFNRKFSFSCMHFLFWLIKQFYKLMKYKKFSALKMKYRCWTRIYCKNNQKNKFRFTWITSKKHQSFKYVNYSATGFKWFKPKCKDIPIPFPARLQIKISY